MKLRLLIAFCLLINVVAFSQPINDDPCNAIPLTIGTTCNQTTSNNFGATASAGVPAPGCGTYSGGDVWFSVTCPASGTFSISTNYAGLPDLAIATYTGSCSSLSLAACNYIGSGAGNFPHINVTGATGGVVYYIRAWNPSNTTLGDFDICVTTPSPNPPIPNNQDCLDAIPICTSSFTTTTSYSGTGSIGNEINPGNTCLGSGEKNDVWYQFTVQNSGQLCFCIDPITNTNDYDWAMFNVTSANCSDIYNSGAALQAACNYSGSTSWTGGSATPSWVLSGATLGCTGLFPSPNDALSETDPCIAVTTGQSFVLNISNFSSSASGFHLYFPPPGTAGMAIIYDNVAPVMQALPVRPQCGGNQMFVKFNENIQCSTVSSADFSLSGPGGPYTISSVVGSGCLGGGTYENQFLLNFTPALTTPGTYTVCLGNSAGSVADACNNLAAPVCYTFTITGPNITVTPTNPNCSTGTGTIVAAASAGTGPYNYSINGGAYQASGTFTSLAAGTYTLTTIDNGTGCQNNTTSTITIPTAISVTATPTNATCANNDGSIATSVTGGTAGYTYAWSPSGTGANPSGLSPATYTVTVTDSKGCTKTATAVITQTGTVTANFTTPASQCLTGNSFSFTNTGTAGVTYNWNYGDAGTGSSSSVSHTYASSGTFTVTETVTSGVCSATHTAAITVKPMPTVTVNSPTVCAGNSVSLTAAGASTYTWNTGSTANPLSVTPGATSYTVTGTSAVGCTNTAVSTVTVAASPTVTVSSATMCPGASMTLTASGASTYTWAPSATLSSSTGSSVTASPTVTTVYTITGTSAASCTATTTATVTIGGAITPSVPSATICAGSSTTLNATGGTTYTWSPATGLSGTSGASVTANPASTTTYTINAANGACTGSTTAVVTVNPLPTVTVNSPSICINGSTTLNASGAATYSWSPSTGLSATTGASVTANPTVTTTYTVVGTTATCTAQATSIVTVNPLPTITVNAPSICPGATGTLTASGASTYTWNTGANGATITDSPSSTTNYTVTGTSAAGCVSTATTSITVLSGLTITPPSATICVGASTTLTASGASTYTWSPGTGLSSTTGASVTANPTVSTTYTITGSSGTCSATATATLIVNPLPTVSVNSGTICIGQQTATLTASGASTYTWNPATGLSSANGSSVVANPTSTTSYTVSGTDGNGCVNTATTTVVANPTPTITVNAPAICPGATGTLTASGASTYTWNTGANGATITDSPSSTTNYTVTGTSAAGCVSTATTSITVLSGLTITPPSATICVGASTTLTASGAATYTWSPGTGLSSTTGASVTANPTVSTTYTITGSSGTCSATATATLIVNPLPTVSVNSGTICIGQQTATLTASGASTYTWNPATGLSSANGSPVVANPTSTTSYTVSGTDGNGCVNTATTTVVANPTPTLTLNSGFICNGSSTTLNASGASTYAWSPGTGLSATTGASVTANPTVTTQYTITGTDVNGCTGTDTTSVIVVANPIVTVASATICINNSATLTAAGASTYVWANGTGLSSTSGTSVNASPATTTVYTITGTAGTCTAVTTATVTVNSLPNVTVNSQTICLGQQTATLSAAGALTYSWDPSSGLSSTTGTSVTGTPSVTTSYTVIGTDVNGCVNTATTSITVNPIPTVTVSPGLICVGSSTTLTAGGAVTYSWMPGTGLSSTTGSSVNANPATTTQYTVVGIDANGCVNGDTATLTVVANPVISVASSTICIGNSTNLTANGATTYTWSPATGLNTTSGANVTANPTVTSVYTIDGTAGTCTATTTATVVVNPLPVITIGSNSPVCVNQTLNLTSSGGPGYFWNGPNNFTSTLQNPNITGVTTAAAGTYTLTIVDINTCVNSATVNVVVNPLPVVTVGGSTVCLNQTISLSASGGTGYSWSGPLGFGSNQQNPTIPNATPGMAGTYVVTVTDTNNCVNANVAQVVLNSIPVVSATSGTVCIGSTIQLIASGANTYAWFPATGLSSASSATVNAGPNATTTYTVIGTDANGCVDTTTTFVNVNPKPVIALTPSASSGCAPVCVSFSNTAGTTGTCTWTFGDGSTSTNCAINHCFNVAGTYTSIYTLTDVNGCKNTDTSITTVYPVPDADFSFDPQPTTILDPYIHFHNQTTGGAMISTLSWTFGDNSGMTSASSAPTHTYLEAGSYPVELVVVSNHGCRDSIKKTVVIGEDYFIYVPNAFSPNMDGVNDSFFAKGEGIKDFKLYIFDRWGNQVFFSDDIYKGWDGRFMGKGEAIVQEDVYVWKIELKTFKNEPKMLKGTVTLIK